MGRAPRFMNMESAPFFERQKNSPYSFSISRVLGDSPSRYERILTRQMNIPNDFEVSLVKNSWKNSSQQKT